MKIAKTFNCCFRLLNRRVFPLSVSKPQCRYFRRYDDLYYAEKSDKTRMYREVGFDPRYDEHHYRKFERRGSSSAPSAEETSSSNAENTMDLVNRQKDIIKQNKVKWQQWQRSTKHIYGIGKPDKGGHPNRRAREIREKERKRQERELRESRKHYNLPGYNRPLKPTKSMAESTPSTPKAEVDDEQQFWHTWHACPRERQAVPETAEDNEESALGFEAPKQRPLVKPSSPYNNSVRRFQTHSVQPAEPFQMYTSSVKPLGADSIWRYKDLKRKSGVSAASPSGINRASAFHMDELPQKMMPQPIYRRNRSHKSKNVGSRVEPPHFRTKAQAPIRKRAPMESFSSQLNLNLGITPCSEYLGYGRQTVCDVWQTFSKGYNPKTSY